MSETQTGRRILMVTALVLLKVARDKVNAVAGTLADMEGSPGKCIPSQAGTIMVIIRKDNQLASSLQPHAEGRGILKSETSWPHTFPTTEHVSIGLKRPAMMVVAVFLTAGRRRRMHFLTVYHHPQSP
jgi:hypothetical protein